MSTKIGSHAAIPNPALKLFESIIGEWRTTGSHPYFPDVVLQGRASFTWIENGAFLQMRQEIDHPDFPDGIAIFGSDDVANAYYMIYFDERNISRKYDVAPTSTGVKWWRNDVHFSQRFTLDFQDDKLIFAGEMSREGGNWEKDLSLTYTKPV